MGFATLNPANAFPPSLIPHQKKMTLPSNYLSFNGGGAGDTDTFAQQYLPELYEAEVERYGNRTIGGFLRMVGAEMPMSSDQVIWSEQIDFMFLTKMLLKMVLIILIFQLKLEKSV